MAGVPGYEGCRAGASGLGVQVLGARRVLDLNINENRLNHQVVEGSSRVEGNNMAEIYTCSSQVLFPIPAPVPSLPPLLGAPSLSACVSRPTDNGTSRRFTKTLPSNSRGSE